MVGWFIGILFVVVGISGYLATSTSPILSWFDNATSATSSQLIPTGVLATSSVIETERDTTIYDSPGGDTLGTQYAGSKGTIFGGPVAFDGQNFYEIHYDDPPDGWVSANDITTHTAIASTVTSVPIFGSFLHEFFSFVAFLFFLIVIYAMWKDKSVDFPPHSGKKKSSPGSDVYGTPAAAPVARSVIPSAPSLPGAVPANAQVNNEHWLHVVALLDSHNQNDWRQAIIEADIMLDEMLGKMGYDASSVGEKLKMIEPSDFTTLDDAWEAHKVRNRLAHQGKDYPLGQTAARQVIGLYEKVFKEFYYI